jgi:sugar phosphate isomerase/epimerase
MLTPIGLQLYTLRQELARNFKGTVTRVAEVGYKGVETFRGMGVTPAEAGTLFRSLGLKVPSAHIGLPLGEQKAEILEAMAALDCRHIVSPWIDPGRYASQASIRELASEFNAAFQVAADNGMRLSIHNHQFEFYLVDGRPAYQILMEHLDPGVLFQVDTYWVKVAGLDPIHVVAELGARAPSLHIKDGPATTDGDHTALGKGVLDIGRIVEAGRPHTEWLIVELDSCGTGMMEAVAESYQYMVNNGLAKGNK